MYSSRKAISIVASIVFTFTVCLGLSATNTANAAGPASGTPVVVSKGLTWVKKKFTMAKPPAGFSVAFDYPYFAAGSSGIAADVVQKLNNEMQNALMSQAKAASKDFTDFYSDEPKLYAEARKHKDGSSMIGTMVVHKCNDNVVSVSFATCCYYYQMAHPVNNYFVFNYELNPLMPITISNMVKNQPEFLNTVSKDCIRQLKKLLHYPDLEIIGDGTKPTVDNFKNFVLLDKQIGFWFNDGQVSIHAEPVEKAIAVSYSLVKNTLNPDSPVYKLAK